MAHKNELYFYKTKTHLYTPYNKKSLTATYIKYVWTPELHSYHLCNVCACVRVHVCVVMLLTSSCQCSKELQAKEHIDGQFQPTNMRIVTYHLNQCCLSLFTTVCRQKVKENKIRL